MFIENDVVLRELGLGRERERVGAFMEGRSVRECRNGGCGECVDWKKRRFVFESVREEWFGGKWKKKKKMKLGF